MRCACDACVSQLGPGRTWNCRAPYPAFPRASVLRSRAAAAPISLMPFLASVESAHRASTSAPLSPARSSRQGLPRHGPAGPRLRAPALSCGLPCSWLWHPHHCRCPAFPHACPPACLHRIARPAECCATRQALCSCQPPATTAPCPLCRCAGGCTQDCPLLSSPTCWCANGGAGGVRCFRQLLECQAAWARAAHPYETCLSCHAECWGRCQGRGWRHRRFPGAHACMKATNRRICDPALLRTTHGPLSPAYGPEATDMAVSRRSVSVATALVVCIALMVIPSAAAVAGEVAMTASRRRASRAAPHAQPACPVPSPHACAHRDAAAALYLASGPCRLGAQGRRPRSRTSPEPSSPPPAPSPRKLTQTPAAPRRAPPAPQARRASPCLRAAARCCRLSPSAAATAAAPSACLMG